MGSSTSSSELSEGEIESFRTCELSYSKGADDVALQYEMLHHSPLHNTVWQSLDKSVLLQGGPTWNKLGCGATNEEDAVKNSHSVICEVLMFELFQMVKNELF